MRLAWGESPTWERLENRSRDSGLWTEHHWNVCVCVCSRNSPSHENAQILLVIDNVSKRSRLPDFSGRHRSGSHGEFIRRAFRNCP
jgi:hypothetical protein